MVVKFKFESEYGEREVKIKVKEKHYSNYL